LADPQEGQPNFKIPDMMRGVALGSISAVNDNPETLSQLVLRGEFEFAATVFPWSVPSNPTLD
jgi:hypothetical protein